MGLKGENILIVGSDGTIGKALATTLEQEGAFVWRTSRYPQSGSRIISLDLSVENKIPLKENKISKVIVCAAVTSIQRCKEEPELSWQVNVVNTVKLVQSCVNAGVFVAFLSTSAVFDGSMPHVGPKVPFSPQNEYGRQKAAAEESLLAIEGRISIVRLSKVISDVMPLFKRWLENLNDGELIYPFNDMVMAPISLDFAVKVLKEILNEESPGITQVSSATDISYAEAVKYLAKRLQIDKSGIMPVSYKIAGIDFSPKYTTFSNIRLKELGFEEPEPFCAFNDFILKFKSDS